MSDMLRSVVTSGTGTGASIGSWYICGKTGTTSLPDHLGNVRGNPDAWFSGYSPLYTATVWMGYDTTDKTHYLVGEYGGTRPAAIWKKVMQKALEGRQVQSSIPQPSGVITVTYDALTGKLPSSTLGGGNQNGWGGWGGWSSLWPNRSYGSDIRTDIATEKGQPTEYGTAADYPRSNYGYNDDYGDEYDDW